MASRVVVVEEDGSGGSARKAACSRWAWWYSSVASRYFSRSRAVHMCSGVSNTAFIFVAVAYFLSRSCRSSELILLIFRKERGEGEGERDNNYLCNAKKSHTKNIPEDGFELYFGAHNVLDNSESPDSTLNR